MLKRRPLLGGMMAGALWGVAGRSARADDTPGVTESEIKIGTIGPLSGPAAAYGVIARADQAYFQMINDQGGINGRKITLIAYDDGYAPPRTVEQARRLVEQDGVAFLYNMLGTAPNMAIQRYLNQKRIPQLFVSSGADRWGDYQDYPWTMGWNPSYRTEARIYAKFLLREQPDTRLGILYQNDDFGRDYIAGVQDVLGDRFDSLVTTASYETTDPTIDSQVVSLREAGVGALLTAATPKFVAQTIRKVYDLNWQPLHFLTNAAISISAVINPAGAEKAVGIVTSAYVKDPTDASWRDDPGLNAWRQFMSRYMPQADPADNLCVYAYGVSATLAQVLKQCGADVTRDNVMKQAANLRNFDPGVLLPGISVNSGPTNYHPIQAMQLARWSGAHWQNFGEVITGTAG